MDDRERVAALFEEAAGELDLASRHLRVAASHFREGAVPPGCAHAFAARGHQARASRRQDEASEVHAGRAGYPDDPRSRAAAPHDPSTIARVEPVARAPAEGEAS